MTSHLSTKEKSAIEEAKSLKMTVLNQDEEMKMLKDMVKSTTLQIAIKDQEIKRIKKRTNYMESQSMGSIPGSPSTRKNNKSSLLPSLNNSSTQDYESF